MEILCLSKNQTRELLVAEPMRWFKVGSDNGGEVHLCEGIALVLELGAEVYEAEPLENIHISGNRLTCSSARTLKKMNWNERIARLFACDCAEHVAHICKDKQVRTAIDAARKYANGKLTESELLVAWSGARNAASKSQWLNEYSAARAASDCAATDIQWATSSATFGAAAKSGSAKDKKGSTLNQSIAWIDERKWQTARLMQYLDEGN
jgi:hypothetical protein